MFRRSSRAVAVALLGLAAAWWAPATAADRLNVLFILTDDMRPELGCYGAPTVTPHLDALAAASVRFDRAYCQYPLCNPSRTSMLTGLMPTQTGVLDNTADFRATLPDHVTLPELFKAHGYTAVRLGKVFHGGIDDAQSWSEGAEPDGPAAGPRPARPGAGRAGSGARAPARPGGARPAPAGGASGPARGTPGPTADGLPSTATDGPPNERAATSDRRIVLPGDGESHGDYRTADACIAALARLKDKPFFLTCGFTKPHSAPAAPQRFYDLYPPGTITLPATFAPYPKPPAGFPAAALPKVNGDLFMGRKALSEEAKLMLQSYRASVSWVDAQVGRVLAALDEQGLRESTVVVFWGDHGYHLGEMGKWAKHGSLFEVGARVPLLISVPGGAGRGRACTRPVQSLDLYPTLAALCGLTPPDGLAGHDLAPLLADPAADWAHPAYTVVGGAKTLHRSVRDDRYRYIEWAGPDGGIALIDEQADPTEQTNLAADPAYASTVVRLNAALGLLPTK